MTSNITSSLTVISSPWGKSCPLAPWWHDDTHQWQSTEQNTKENKEGSSLHQNHQPPFPGNPRIFFLLVRHSFFLVIPAAPCLTLLSSWSDPDSASPSPSHLCGWCSALASLLAFVTWSGGEGTCLSSSPKKAVNVLFKVPGKQDTVLGS